MGYSFIEVGECPRIEPDDAGNYLMDVTGCYILPCKFFMYKFFVIKDYAQRVQKLGNKDQDDFIRDMMRQPENWNFWNNDCALVHTEKNNKRVTLFNLPASIDWVTPVIPKIHDRRPPIKHLDIEVADPRLFHDECDDYGMRLEESLEVMNKLHKYYAVYGWEQNVEGVGYKQISDSSFGPINALTISTKNTGDAPRFMQKRGLSEDSKRAIAEIVHKYRDAALRSCGEKMVWVSINGNDVRPVTNVM
jgi:hypothetical protein